MGVGRLLPWLEDPDRGNDLGMWRHVRLVLLAPDLTLPREYAEAHGLVTAREIAALFCTPESQVRSWTADPYFPPVRGRLVDEETHAALAKLYLLCEVRQYLAWAEPGLSYVVWEPSLEDLDLDR